MAHLQPGNHAPGWQALQRFIRLGRAGKFKPTGQCMAGV